MKRILFNRFGEPADVLYVEDMEAVPPGPGEVLLQLRSRPINPADIALIRGAYVPPESWPACPGMEAVGTVKETGAGVDTVKAGERYIVSRVRGTWSEMMTVPVSALIPVEDDIPDAVACQLSINPLTAQLLLQCVDKSGAVIQTAAGSAVGRLVNQLAMVQGRTIINLVRRQDTADDLRDQGYPHVIISDTENWQEQVREAAGNEPVIAAFDPVAGKTGQTLLSVLSKGGALILYGGLSGEPVPVTAMQLAGNDLSVRGFWLGPWFEQADAGEKLAVYARLQEMFRNNQLSIPVAGVFDLTDVKHAIASDQAPGRLGKILLQS